jgi:hypothetical protein
MVSLVGSAGHFGWQWWAGRWRYALLHVLLVFAVGNQHCKHLVEGCA